MASAVSTPRRQREVTKEALAGPDQATQSLSLLLATELELGRVVHDQHAFMLASATHALPEVRGENRLGRHPVVPEESIRRLQLGVVERVREPHARTLGDQIREHPQAAVQPLVAQLGPAQLDRQLRRPLMPLSSHPRRGSRPGSPRKDV